MKNILAFCALALCLAHSCVRPAQGKEVDCGWGKWNDENYYKLYGGQPPPEGACPPGPQTEPGTPYTAWKWKPFPEIGDDTSGRRGANRVVKAHGYVGVRGTFEEPNIDEINDDEVEGREGRDRHQNKPTFYLGVSQEANIFGEIRGLKVSHSGQTQTDAGFQWTPETNDANPKAGWKWFHRITISTGYDVKSVNPNTQAVETTRIGGAWEIWVDSRDKRWLKNELGSVTLTYYINEAGYASLNMRGDNIPYVKPEDYPTSLLATNGKLRIDKIDVRRVVGLTQAYTHKELKPYGNSVNYSSYASKIPSPPYKTQAIMDGSVVTGLIFSGGQLTESLVGVGKDWPTWPTSRNSEALFPNTKEEGVWVINFAKITPTGPRSKKEGKYSPDFSAENVEIRMGNPKKVEGKK